MKDTPTVYMLCGLTGSGKTTHAEKLVKKGFKRLSVDEVVFERHGRHGVDYPEHEYPTHETEARNNLEKRLVDLLNHGESVVLDYGFWSREDRDHYKRLIESNGGEWRLLYFKVDHDELLERLRKRNERTDANALKVTEDMLTGDFVNRFEEPQNEGEDVIT